MTLDPGSYELHRLDIDLSPASIATAHELLSAAERARMASYRLAAQGHRFAVVRAWVRRMLAEHLAASPAELPIWSPRHEKPRLEEGMPDLRFSVSHSGDLAMCCIAAGLEVGIDIEVDRTPAATAALATTVLDEKERAAIDLLRPEERHEAILREWTRKEAMLKALGTGLRLPPAHLRLGMGPEPCPAPVEVVVASRTWTVRDLAPRRNAIGALVVEA